MIVLAVVDSADRTIATGTDAPPIIATSHQLDGRRARPRVLGEVDGRTIFGGYFDPSEPE